MEINKYIISSDKSVLEAMDAINVNGRGLVFVCDGSNALVGVITDGDIRRFILSGGALNDNTYDLANKNPKFILKGDNIDAEEYMQKMKINCLPILNKKREIISIRFLEGEEIFTEKKLNVPVVIMAGGKGTRLQPYTNILPKPLIPIGEKTITEIIMDKFRLFGCNEFTMIVNYKKNLIRAFFSEQNNYKVSFVEERQFLGTGGGLKLLAGMMKNTFFMTNCDVVINEDYEDILDFHRKKNAVITMVCAAQVYTVPYGTVNLDKNGNAADMTEKPELSYIVNTGMYVIEPEFIDMIPDDTFIHITDIIEKCIKDGKTVAVYPISASSWLDMGQMNELDKMRKNFEMQ